MNMLVSATAVVDALKIIAASPADAPLGDSPVRPHDDLSALVELGRRASELETWFDAQEGRTDLAENDPEYELNTEKHDDLLETIIETPARSAQELRAKAERILFYCKGAGEPADTAGVIGLSLARDILRNA